MNKSLITNLLALFITLTGYFLSLPIIFSIGLFALSGAFTNWLAVHMLFEKIPGLYGSGIIPNRFEEFKAGIKQLIMEQFFTEENIQRFIGETSTNTSFNLAPVIEEVDLNPAFDGLVDVIEKSSFGGMLAMVGGSEALQPMREPFIKKMKTSVIDLTQTQAFTDSVQKHVLPNNVSESIFEKVSVIIEQRLNELTPSLVKEIIQAMIKKHLGWLVVWGGIFGGLFGFIAAIV